MKCLSKQEIQYYKDTYPKGTRVVLDHMADDPRPIPPGTAGTVKAVDDIGQIHCAFDNGRYLAICPEVDTFHKIEPEEGESPTMSM